MMFAMLYIVWYILDGYLDWYFKDYVTLHYSVIIIRGAKQGGGVGGSQPPPLNFGWGVEHLSTPPDLEKKFLAGVGSPYIDLTI